MDVQLPQEDIEYVHAASFNDALTYIPFTPLDAHLGSAHLPWSRFTFILITHSRLSSRTSGNLPTAPWTRLPLCVLSFSFFFLRPIFISPFLARFPAGAASRRAFYVRVFVSFSSSYPTNASAIILRLFAHHPSHF
jgi:hypothetical protein